MLIHVHFLFLEQNYITVQTCWISWANFSIKYAPTPVTKGRKLGRVGVMWGTSWMMRCRTHLLSKMHGLQNRKGFNYFVSNWHIFFKVCFFCPKTNKISYRFRSSMINCPQNTPEPLQVPHAATWTLPNYSEMLYPCQISKVCR